MASRSDTPSTWLLVSAGRAILLAGLLAQAAYGRPAEAGRDPVPVAAVTSAAVPR